VDKQTVDPNYGSSASGKINAEFKLPSVSMLKDALRGVSGEQLIHVIRPALSLCVV
jgi:hypothetical protein